MVVAQAASSRGTAAKRRSQSRRGGGESRQVERRLLASLGDVGQLTPIVVVGDGSEHFVVIDGYKRVRLLPRLGADTVRATAWDLDELDAITLEHSMRRRETSTAIEQGWLLVALRDRFRLSLDELARRFDVSKSWVSRRLALVGDLPPAIQRAVRQGEVGAHAAMKYLVPLARANAEDAGRLCQAIGSLSLSSRQVGTLYAAYHSSSAEARELILTQPDVFLRAQQESQRSDTPPDPAERLLRDLGSLAGIARRVRRDVRDGVVRRLDSAHRREVERCVRQARLDTEALFTVADKELADARSEHTDGDSRAA